MRDDYNIFIEKMHKKTGIDLSSYKEAQMKRRLIALYEKRGLASFTEFFMAMEKNESLLIECIDRMTINVSEFFRNKNRWDVLREKVVPELTKSNTHIKIWSSACSTGEEPYTLAMILLEVLPRANFSIMATDIDQAALEKAKKGQYSSRAFREMPEKYIKKYFIEEANHYQINDRVKSCVSFESLNLLSDEYPADCDLIICRNVLIYFTDEAKHEVYKKFQAALKPGGIIFVGSTEQIFTPSKYNLQTYDTFFYRKK